MIIVHLLVLALCVGAAVLLRRYIHEKLPSPTSQYVAPLRRPWIAFSWLWDALIWLLPSLMWIEAFPDIPIGYILALGFLVELSYLLLFFWVCGVFAFSESGSPVMKAFSAILAGSVILITGVVALAGVWNYGVSWYQLLALLVTSLCGPSTLTLLLGIWSQRIVPLPDGLPGVSGQAMRMVLGYFTSFPKPIWFVEEGEIRTRITGSPYFGSGPGCVVTEPENVVLLKTASDISELLDPARS